MNENKYQNNQKQTFYRILGVHQRKKEIHVHKSDGETKEAKVIQEK